MEKKEPKRFAVTVRLIQASGSARRAIRRGAQLHDHLQKAVNRRAPGTEVSLVIPHKYTERLARPAVPRGERMIRVAEVERLTGMSRTTIWRAERAGRFPNRRRLSANIVAWSESEVRAWQKARPATTL